MHSWCMMHALRAWLAGWLAGRYEPIFKAVLLDGREVWRRRVYRVRRAAEPGTFHLSVLDSGVTSKVT